MPGKKEKGKNPMCQYERHDYKCNRNLYDHEYCIFHSTEIEGKKNQFNDEFWKEYETGKTNDKFDFIGFVFPDRFNLKEADLNGAFLQGAILPGADLQDAKLKGANLRNANLEGVNLQKAFFMEANLQGANLKRANLREADLRGSILIEIDLKEAKLQGARLQDANFKGANLKEADLKGTILLGSNLKEVKLQGANIQKADLEKADLQGAQLQKTNIQGAKLQGSNLREADLSFANLKRADLRKSVLKNTTFRNVKLNRQTKCLGIDVTQAKGSPRFVRFAKDQEYLEELRESTNFGKFVYWAWFILADCGRSLWPWALWSLFFAVAFACIFCCMGPAAFEIDKLSYSFITMLYYSVVTFTTLGFGDIIPKTTGASIVVMAEVIVGYVMLGGLISIFANKLARRS